MVDKIAKTKSHSGVESMTNYFLPLNFVTSVATTKQLPKDFLPEIACIGRSNVGKSSIINALAHSKGLARISKTPGRTQLLNYFSLGTMGYLVDFPGYGYAKAPQVLQEQWHKQRESYLLNRKNLHGILLIMDIRHPMGKEDSKFLAFIAAKRPDVPIHLILNKADKLSRMQQQKILAEVKEKLVPLEPKKNLYTCQNFSARKPDASEREIWQIINQWLIQIPG